MLLLRVHSEQVFERDEDRAKKQEGLPVEEVQKGVHVLKHQWDEAIRNCNDEPAVSLIFGQKPLFG